MASYGDLQFITTSRSSTVRGLAWPMRIDNTGGWCSAVYNEEAVKDGLIQLLLTQRGERPMRPDFGTDLRVSVFAPMDAITIEQLKASISRAIEKYAPRVVVRTFNVKPDHEKSELVLSLVFHMKENVFTVQGINLTVNSKGIIING